MQALQQRPHQPGPMTSRHAKNPSSPPGVPTLAVGDIVELLVLDVLATDAWESWGGTGVREGGHPGFFAASPQVPPRTVVFQVGVQPRMVDTTLDADALENPTDPGHHLVVGEACQGSD